MKNPEKIWLTVDETAAELGVTRQAVYRMIDSGTIRAYKIGRVVRIRRQDLEAIAPASPDEDGQ